MLNMVAEILSHHPFLAPQNPWPALSFILIIIVIVLCLHQHLLCVHQRCPCGMMMFGNQKKSLNKKRSLNNHAKQYEKEVM